MKTPPRARPWAFFPLVFALCLPFWFLGAATGASILPRLPITALMAVAPGLAAAALVYRDGGSVRALVVRAFDISCTRPAIWYPAAILIMPAATALSFLLMRWSAIAVPAAQLSANGILGLFLIFFPGAALEELGWSGYVLEPLEKRFGASVSSLLIGGFGASLHVVPLLQAGRSVSWIGWWALATLAMRVVMVWLYDNSGRSVFLVTLFHTTINVSWQSFPVQGSYWDPKFLAPVMVTLALCATLSRGRWR
jgi:hypothetical protein